MLSTLGDTMKIMIRNKTPVNGAGLAALLRLEAPKTIIFHAQSCDEAARIALKHQIDVCIATPYLSPHDNQPVPRIPEGISGSHVKLVGVQALTDTVLHDAENAGYDGVIDLNDSVGNLIGEIEKFRCGKLTLQNEIEAFSKSHHPSSSFSLRDDMDRHIVSLIGLGYSDQQIANPVYLSCQSVRNRISRILRDSHLQNRTQLAVSYLCEHMGVVYGTAKAS
jgi:DNA-binding NarL/FixJ family response regulator